jgi:hypothetical protein
VEKNNHSSFTPGFVLGIFSGVVGYYLFGTKRGEKTRKKLANEWESAQQHLVDQGVLGKDSKFDSLGDLVQLAKDELLKKLEVEPAEPKKDKTPRKKRTYKRQTKQKQFKGV